MIRAILILAALLVVLVLGVLLLLEDPGRYQSQLAGAVRNNTGYHLTVEGDIGWRLWPPIAIDVSGAGLAVAEDADPFVRIGELELDVDLLPILQQQDVLNVNHLRLRDVTASLTVDDTGQNTWTVTDAPTPDDASSASESEGSPRTITPTVQQLILENIQVNYSKQQTGDHYQLTLTELKTSQLAAKAPFTADWSIQVLDNTAQRSVTLEGHGEFQWQDERVDFNDVRFVSTVERDGDNLPEVTTLLSGAYRFEKNAFSFEQATIQLPGLSISAPLNVVIGDDAPQFRGEVSIQSNNLRKVATGFGLAVPVTGADLTARLIGSTDRFRLAELTGTVDDSQLKGSITMIQDTVPTLSADLRIDTLNTASYLAAGPETVRVNAATSTAPTPKDAEVIPADLLQSINTDSIIRLGELAHEGNVFNNVKVEIKNQGAVLALLISAKGMGGNILASLDTDRSLDSALKVSLDGLDVTQLSDIQGLTGRLTGHSTTTFQGSLMSELADSISGRTVFTVEDGTLDVRPIKRMALSIDTIRGKRSRVSDWPDLMPFEQLVGEHVLDNGLAQGQFFEMQLENITVNGHGGVDLIEEVLDYRVTAMFEAREDGPFKVSEQLAGIRWPMTCRGPFTATPADLCFGEEGAIANLVSDVIRQGLRRRGQRKLDEAIEEKVPEELRGLFKGLIRRD